MKKSNLFMILCVTCCLVLLLVAPRAWAQEVGRYQLHQVTYNHTDWDSGTTEDRKEVFLLDTATGDVQVYVSGATKGKRVKYWEPAVVGETKT